MQRRRRTRVAAGKEATVEWGGQSLHGALRDLSLKGAYVAAAPGPRPEAGQGVTCRIHLEPGAAELDLVLAARAVRVEEGGVALDFVEVPAESFPHLLRLVQYNAPDPDEIEAEILEPAFRRGEGD